MIVSRIKGGLGNQIFQYAIGKRLALKHNTEHYLDLTLMKDYNLRKVEIFKFNIASKPLKKAHLLYLYPPSFFYHFYNYKILRKLIPGFYNSFSHMEQGLFRNALAEGSHMKDKSPLSRILVEKFYHFDSEVLKAPNNILIMGYFLSEKYFHDIRDVLIKELTLKATLNCQNKKFESLILKNNSVSVHIRRGDYLNKNNISVFTNLPLNYYKNSIDVICKKLSDPSFVFFSDDIEWVRENFKWLNFPKFYIEGNDANPEIDLHLMKLCQHNITANSTFSWWGAWLNENPGKIVLTPYNWFNLPNHSQKDLVPDNWVKISY